MSILNLTESELEQVVSSEDAGHVLYVLDGTEGISPGSFTRSLIETLTLADPNNFRALSRVFPGVASAVDAYTGDWNGKDVLLKIFNK